MVFLLKRNVNNRSKISRIDERIENKTSTELRLKMSKICSSTQVDRWKVDNYSRKAKRRKRGIAKRGGLNETLSHRLQRKNDVNADQ